MTHDSMAQTWAAWYRAQDALISLDIALAQVPGVADESAQMTRAIRRMRTEGDRIMAAARTAEEPGHRTGGAPAAMDAARDPRVRSTRLTCDRCRDEELVYLVESDELLCTACDL